MRHRSYIGIGPVLVALLVATAVLGSATIAVPAAGAAGKHITIKNMAFTPQAITVKAGTKVTWKNADGVAHNVASANSMQTTAALTGLFASPTLSNGQSFSFTFRTKGTFYYECTFHASMASMHGKVIVK